MRGSTTFLLQHLSQKQRPHRRQWCCNENGGSGSTINSDTTGSHNSCCKFALRAGIFTHNIFFFFNRTHRKSKEREIYGHGEGQHWVSWWERRGGQSWKEAGNWLRWSPEGNSQREKKQNKLHYCSALQQTAESDRSTSYSKRKRNQSTEAVSFLCHSGQSFFFFFILKAAQNKSRVTDGLADLPFKAKTKKKQKKQLISRCDLEHLRAHLVEELL